MKVQSIVATTTAAAVVLTIPVTAWDGPAVVGRLGMTGRVARS